MYLNEYKCTGITLSKWGMGKLGLSVTYIIGENQNQNEAWCLESTDWFFQGQVEQVMFSLILIHFRIWTSYKIWLYLVFPVDF